MSEPTRRQFLVGVVAAAVGNELVVQATPDEVALFSRDTRVSTAPVPISDWHDVMVYNRNGVAIGQIVQVTASAPMSDMTSAQDQFQVWKPSGFQTWKGEIEFFGFPPFPSFSRR